MNLFETVKNNVSLREAAQAYGLEVNRHGKALCPFHNDRPSKAICLSTTAAITPWAKVTRSLSLTK